MSHTSFPPGSAFCKVNFPKVKSEASLFLWTAILLPGLSSTSQVGNTCLLSPIRNSQQVPPCRLLPLPWREICLPLPVRARTKALSHDWLSSYPHQPSNRSFMCPHPGEGSTPVCPLEHKIMKRRYLHDKAGDTAQANSQLTQQTLLHYH